TGSEVGQYSHSIYEGFSGNLSHGNKASDPKFIDVDNRNFALQSTSPAVHAGDDELYANTGGDLENDKDLDGNDRRRLGRIDMGAFESPYGPPVNTVLPMISSATGFTVDEGTWSGNPTPAYTYKWMKADTESGTYTYIPDAVSNTYTPTASDLGKWFKVEVTATNDVAAMAVTSAAVAPGLQQIIDATPQDGVIELPSGIYQISTQLTIADGKRITIRATGGKATIQQTVASASATGRIFRVGESLLNTSHLTLENMALTGGKQSGSDGGGAIYVVRGGSLTLIDSKITGNQSTTGGGGGIKIGDQVSSTGTLTMINTDIADNIASSYGGGIFIGNGYTPTILGGKIESNQSDALGGGIFAWINAAGYVRGVSFIDNIANDVPDHVGYATGGGQGGLNVEGNYWAPFHTTSGLTVTPANPCADGSCMVTLTMALQGEGSGTVGMVHNSAADLGYTAIF